MLGARLLVTTDGDVDAAFWLLAALCEGPLRGYHEQDMAACGIEAAVLVGETSATWCIQRNKTDHAEEVLAQAAEAADSC